MKKLLTLTAIALTFASSAAFAYNDNDGHHYSEGMESRFLKIDVNNDGYVGRAEFQASANNMFNESDYNHDNVLSRDEYWDQKKRYHNAWDNQTPIYSSGQKNNYDSNIVDHNMDPRYYNNKRANRINDTEYDNKSY